MAAGEESPTGEGLRKPGHTSHMTENQPNCGAILLSLALTGARKRKAFEKAQDKEWATKVPVVGRRCAD